MRNNNPQWMTVNNYFVVAIPCECHSMLEINRRTYTRSMEYSKRMQPTLLGCERESLGVLNNGIVRACLSGDFEEQTQRLLIPSMMHMLGCVGEHI